MFRFFSAILIFFLCTACGLSGFAQKKDLPVNFVNPLIGTAGHGHVFLGANVPFGMVQVGPNNIGKGWDWCSGYHYSSKEILGFSHLHLSGTGIGDWGDILVLPATDKPKTIAARKDDLSDGYGSPFDHSNEECKPGYYKIYLDRYKLTAEISATSRAAIHHYRYDAGVNNPHILLDLSFGIGWDGPKDMDLRRLDDSTYIGHRLSKGWADDQRVFFAIRFRNKLGKIEIFNDTSKNNMAHAAAFHPHLDTDGTVDFKVAISSVSTENALLNLVTEMPHWNFNQYREQATQLWNEALSVVDYKADHKKKTIFYTALYHSFFFPSVYDDVNGEYRSSDQMVRQGVTNTNYTVFSLWDTYRAQHPMLTILKPRMVDDLINTMLRIYQEQGKLPVWHLSGNETNTMVGYSAVPVVVDAWRKGFRGFDSNLAYEAVRHSSLQGTDGIQYIRKLQYIPADSVHEAVAKALEYAISDGCIALMAEGLGHEGDASYYNKRSKMYSEYYDPETRFMRGKMADGTWRPGFSPFEAKHRENDYCEGNAWQYTWLAPQDVNGLIELLGGAARFEAKLDSLFVVTGDMGENASVDISGLIGQYAHGNEPSHHIPYLYNYIDRQDKTATLVHRIMHEMYTDKPDGLCGNEDVGQMSAWYILSAMGFYPVHPAEGIFQIGTPMMNEARIKLPDNKTFIIKVKRKKAEDYLVKSMKLNGQPYTKNYIHYKEIMAGGILEFILGK